jgi:signal transduction histidine kinase
MTKTKTVAESPAASALWLAPQGTQNAFAVGMALVIAIPMLILGYVFLSRFGMTEELPQSLEAVAFGAIPLFILLGYFLLRKYPTNIARLRVHLQRMVGVEFPEAQTLIASEDDMRAIEASLNLLFNALKDKIALAEREQDSLRRRLEAEIAIVGKMEQADRAKRRFVETLAQELTSPLAPLSSAIELFMDGRLGPVTPNQMEILDLMKRNIERVKRLATDMPSLSENGVATNAVTPAVDGSTT